MSSTLNEVHQGELTNMKAQLGKQTGIALALLATLLATLFAMGVYTVAQADDHSAMRSITPNPVAPGGEITVTIELANFAAGGVVEDTYPSGYTLASAGDFTERGNTGVSYLILAAGQSASVSYTLTAPMTPGESEAFSGTFASGGDAQPIEGDDTVTVSETSTGGNGGVDGTIALSSQTPGAAVQITISSNAATAIEPNEDIRVDLSAFGVPDTIADSAIDITSGSYKGNPSNVVVSGSNVTMTVPNVRANGDPQNNPVSGAYTIRIKQAAGVTNAASGGTKTVEWQENFPDGDEKEANTSIDRVISLSETSGTRGTMITATFKGFANGSATVNLNDAKHGEVTIADNTGTLEIDTTSSAFKANQANTITAQDAAGNDQDVSGSFTVSPKATVSPEESPVSKEVTINLSDWPASNSVTKVTVGASDVTSSAGAVSTNADGAAEFKVMIPSDANRGTQTVKVTGTDPDGDGDMSAPSATASLTVGVLSLTIQPAMVVPGQQITIEGSGFVAGDNISSVKIGNQTANVNATANSAGDVVIAVNVPSDEDDGIGSGKKTISVTATGSGRVAEGSIEIPKATITVDPETSRRGTTVNVSGSGFPSGDLVQVKYEDGNNFVTVAAGSADASGAVSIDFVVPSYARIGSTHDVEATSVGVYASVTAKDTHETPGAMVSLSTDSVSSGEMITISGMNFPAFATVAVMEIGGVDVRPVPAPASSIDGDFTSSVLVPQLELGNQTVTVRVSQTTITTFLEIATATVSRAPADLFAGLIEADMLDRIFLYDNTDQSWYLYDPDPGFEAANSLEALESGNIIWIQLKGAAEVQGQNLLAGWSLITVQ